MYLDNSNTLQIKPHQMHTSRNLGIFVCQKKNKYNYIIRMRLILDIESADVIVLSRKTSKQNFGPQGRHLIVGDFERYNILEEKTHKQNFEPQGRHLIVGNFEQVKKVTKN